MVTCNGCNIYFGWFGMFFRVWVIRYTQYSGLLPLLHPIYRLVTLVTPDPVARYPCYT